MKYPIVGIFGQKENGKSTLAKMLYELAAGDTEPHRQFLPTVTGFAEPLKATLCKLTGISRETLEKYKNENTILPGWNVNVRTALQQLGECIRGIKSDAWIQSALSDTRQLILQDGRYFNELKAIKAKGGFTILIMKSDKWVDPHTRDLHESEIDMGKAALAYGAIRGPLGYLGDSVEWASKWMNEYRQLFDYVVWNNESLVALQDTAELIYNNHLRD